MTMIINNFSPIELKEARKIVDEVKVKKKIEKVYFKFLLTRLHRLCLCAAPEES